MQLHKPVAPPGRAKAAVTRKSRNRGKP